MEGSRHERASLLFVARAALHALPDVILLVDRESRCHFANRGARTLIGRPWSVIRGLQLREILPAELASPLEELAAAALRVQHQATGLVARGPHGNSFELTAEPLTEDDVLLVVRDVTMLREAAVNAARHQALYNTVFEHAPLGIVLYDQLLTVVDCNDVFAHTLGSTRERIVGLTMDDFRDQRYRELVLRALAGQIIKEEVPYEATTSERWLWVAAIFVPLRDATGAVSHAMVFVRERSADGAARQLAIAHDVDNLLTIMRANLDLAVASLPMEAEVQSELADALEAARRIADFIRKLLASS